jgi:hypothetical protein
MKYFDFVYLVLKNLNNINNFLLFGIDSLTQIG